MEKVVIVLDEVNYGLKLSTAINFSSASQVVIVVCFLFVCVM